MQITIQGPQARVRIHHEVAYARDGETGLWLTRAESDDELIDNIILDAGRVQLHAQCYKTSGLLTNGFNYIALSNDAGAPAAGDTVLAGELAADGLGRAQGAVTPPTGAGNQTVVEKVFTYTGGGSQGVQKCALFTAGAGGVMAHEVQFTLRTMNISDILAITYTITLG